MAVNLHQTLLQILHQSLHQTLLQSLHQSLQVEAVILGQAGILQVEAAAGILQVEAGAVLAGGGCDLAGVGCCCDLLVLQKEVRLVLVDNIKILTNALVN